MWIATQDSPCQVYVVSFYLQLITVVLPEVLLFKHAETAAAEGAAARAHPGSTLYVRLLCLVTDKDSCPC
jgi:hypothetical protein